MGQIFVAFSGYLNLAKIQKSLWLPWDQWIFTLYTRGVKMYIYMTRPPANSANEIWVYSTGNHLELRSALSCEGWCALRKVVWPITTFLMLPCSGTQYIVQHKSTSAVWLALPSQTAICATKCRKDHSRCGYLNAGFCHHRLHSRFSSCPHYYIQFFTPVLYTVAFSISHIWELWFFCLDHLDSHGKGQ